MKLTYQDTLTFVQRRLYNSSQPAIATKWCFVIEGSLLGLSFMCLDEKQWAMFIDDESYKAHQSSLTIPPVPALSGCHDLQAQSMSLTYRAQNSSFEKGHALRMRKAAKSLSLFEKCPLPGH